MGLTFVESTAINRIVKRAGMGHLPEPTARAIILEIEQARADEREACAKIAEHGGDVETGAPEIIASRIRARG